MEANGAIQIHNASRKSLRRISPETLSAYRAAIDGRAGFAVESGSLTGHPFTADG